MKAGHGKSKGSAFERQICLALSLRITNGKRKDVFWRSAMSGGRATVHGKHVRQAGDIAAVAPEGHALVETYYFECKFYKNLRVESFLIEHKGPMQQFWKQTCREARKHGRFPVLVAKQNNRPIIVITGTFRDPKALLFKTWLKELP